MPNQPRPGNDGRNDARLVAARDAVEVAYRQTRGMPPEVVGDAIRAALAKVETEDTDA